MVDERAESLGSNMLPGEVLLWAEDVRPETWQSLDAVAKLRLSSELYREQQRRIMTALTGHHPAESEDDLRLRVACLRYGRSLVERLTGRKLAW